MFHIEMPNLILKGVVNLHHGIKSIFINVLLVNELGFMGPLGFIQLLLELHILIHQFLDSFLAFL